MCVSLCDLNTCYAIGRALFQRLKVKCDEPLSNVAFNFNLHHYNKVAKMSPREKAAFLEKRAKKAAKKSQAKVVMTR